MEDEIIDIQQLSGLLKKRVATIRSDMVRNPAGLPPWFKLPGSRKPLWRRDTTLKFLHDNAARAGALP